MAHTVPALSSDDQRALQHAVSDAVASAQAADNTIESVASKKKKKKRARDESTAATEEIHVEESRRKKRKKHQEQDGASVEAAIEEPQSEVPQTEEKRKKKKRKHKSILTEQEEQEQEYVVEGRVDAPVAALQQMEIGGVDNTMDGPLVPLKKKRKKDKGKQPAVAETATSTLGLPTEAASAPSLETPYTTPHDLLATLFSSVPQPGTDVPVIDPSLLPPAYVPPNLSQPLPFQLPPPGQHAPDFPVPDLNQILADINAASAGSSALHDASSAPTQNTSAEDLLRILEALSMMDPSKIPGVFKTLNDVVTQNTSSPAGPSAPVPISIPTPGSLPSGQRRPDPTRLNPRTLANLAITQTLAPAPFNQAPRTAASIIGSHSNPSASVAGPVSGGQRTSDAHTYILSHKWLSSAALGEMVKNEGLVYKKGKFSKVEDQLLEDAIDTYARDNGLSREQMQEIIFAKDKSKEASFWSELTQAVPGRPIIAVYHHVRRLHHPLRESGGQGDWTPEEDTALERAYLEHGPAWERISQSVGRMAVHCRDRYRNHIAERKTRATGTWSKEEEDELISIIMEITAQNGEQDEIFWGRVSQRMGGKRGRQQCRGKWMDQLRHRVKTNNDGSRWSSHDAYILVHKINSLQVQHDSEIDWKTLPDDQWNAWSPHLIQMRWRTMRAGVKGWEDMTHAEIMNILLEKKGQMLPFVKQPHRRVTSAQEVQPEMDRDDAAATVSHLGAVTTSTVPFVVATHNRDKVSSTSDDGARLRPEEGRIKKKKKKQVTDEMVDALANEQTKKKKKTKTRVDNE